MKKRLLSAVMASAMVLSLAACGGAKTETTAAETSAESKEETTAADTTAAEETKTAGGTLIVGFDQDFPPMGFLGDNGEYTGFDLELAQAVCDLKGWKLKKQPIVWDNKDNELNSGSIDCIWNGFTMNGREDSYTWSDAYVDNSQVIVTKKSADITKLTDLKGKVVGVQAASAALDVLESSEDGGQKALADTFKTLQEFADYNTAFVELEAGSVDAIAMDIGVAQYQIKSRGNDKYIILDEHLNAEKYAIGFKKGNDSLCKEVNEALHTLKKNGTFDKLAEKYELSDMVCLKN